MTQVFLYHWRPDTLEIPTGLEVKEKNILQ